MLLLTRKPDEAINIGKDIKIQVMEVQGKQVRIGIDAPRAVNIYREEIYSKTQDMLKKN